MKIIPLVMRIVAADLRHSRHCLVPAQFRLLGMLAHRAWTLSELAEVQAVSLPTMSSTITTLEERNWLTRQRSPEDRRVVLVELTSQGRAVIEEAHYHAEEQIAEMLAPLGEEERQRLLQGLEILRKVFEANLPEADRRKP